MGKCQIHGNQLPPTSLPYFTIVDPLDLFVDPAPADPWQTWGEVLPFFAEQHPPFLHED